MNVEPREPAGEMDDGPAGGEAGRGADRDADRESGRGGEPFGRGRNRVKAYDVGPDAKVYRSRAHRRRRLGRHQRRA